MKIKLFLISCCMTIFTSQTFSHMPFLTIVTNNNELKILSWNIYMLPYISLFNNNGERAKAIADKLQYSDYQIIVFQEAFSSKCRNILAKGLLNEYPFQYGPANRNNLPFKTNSGLWVVSKIPLKELGEFQFSRCAGFDAVARKGAVLFEGNFQGANFQLLTTHLQADYSHDVRSKQCAEIKEHLLNPYFRKDTPQLICGDFNIDMDDKPNYQQMLQTLDAKNGELSGTVNVTYDEVNNNLARSASGKRRIIDYVLVRNGELIHNIERKVQTFLSKINGYETNLSDHYAMEFVVNFNVVDKSLAQLGY
jgi:endonuclease/exonuclease/phosphatase family metal-dependent hydrolase